VADEADFQPVVIIGAPRSGTNMLRDLLAAFPGVVTWPCDEINLVWRHGNARWPDDALPPDRATASARRYIRDAFSRQARRGAARVVVEKTCANSLRVDFVDRVLPEARFIHLVRDGRDAVASALQRWTAPFELAYTLRKVRFVPLGDLPYYAARYLGNRCWRLVSRQRRIARWGPRFRDMDHWLGSQPLPEVCAEQWRQCVRQATASLARLPPRRVATVRYESLVREPRLEITRLLQFVGIPYHPELLEAVVSGVSARSVGRWRIALDAEFAARLGPVVEETLLQLNWRDALHATAA
jgi:hypothetical protein